MLLFCGFVTSVVKSLEKKKKRFYGAASVIIIQISTLSFRFSAFTERVMNIYILGNVFIQMRYVVLYERLCQLNWLSLRVN